MSLARQARALGARIEVAHLGPCCAPALLAEYDARCRTIRLNAAVMARLRGRERRRFVVRAIAHELYHHLEAIGAVRMQSTRAQREASAERFARRAAP
jgi:hypothetical protein